jgi:hypothetical protein
MSSNINVKMKAEWNGAGAWSGALEFEMVNNTGSTLVNPEIKIQLGQLFIASMNTGFEFAQAGDILTGHLLSHLANVASGETVRFSVGASFPNGGNLSKLPVAYWVNGMNTNGSDTDDSTDTGDSTDPDDSTDSNPDVVAPSVPANIQASNITDTSLSLSWNASTDDVSVAGYKVKYTPAGGVSQTVNVTGTACSLSGLTANTEYSCCVAAFDGSNNLSAYSSAVAAKTLAPVASSIIFAPYVDVTISADWGTNPPGINTRFINSALALGVKSFHLAFLVQDNATKQLVWGNAYFPYNAIKPICDSIHAAGAEPIVAFGGASGVDPSVSRTQAEMTKIYLDLNKDFGIKHIDFDFETAGYYNYKVAFPAALEAKKQNPALWFSLTLPVTPQGLNAEGIAMISYAKQIGLPLNVQIMAMDYGPSDIDMGDTAISAIEGTKANLAAIYPEKTAAELYKLIGVIPMIGQNDVAGEMFTFQDAVQTAQYAKQKGLNLISMWSLVRDFPGMSDLSTCTQNPAQTKDYEYATTIMNALK